MGVAHICASFSSWVEGYPTVWVEGHPTVWPHHILPIHLSNDEHPDCYPLQAVIRNAAINAHVERVCVFLQAHTQEQSY